MVLIDGGYRLYAAMAKSRFPISKRKPLLSSATSI
jgi:hypothetical protein